MESGLTTGDLALMRNRDDDWGGNSFMWIFALLILAGGGFGNWANRGDYGNYATAASQQEILFGQQFQGLDNKIDRLANGLCDSTYALNNAINTASTNLGSMVTTEGRALQTQLANCCCENQRNTDALRYDMATMFANSNAATTAMGQKILDTLSQNKIEALQQKVSALELQNAVCGVVRYPMSTAYCAGNNPFFGCGCNQCI